MKRKAIFLPTLEEVGFDIITYTEDTPVRGNVLASGDPAVDKQAEDAVLVKMETNEWAWCRVEVLANWRGFEGSDTLGCCSYESEEDFKNGGYWEDMKKQAFDNLTTILEYKFRPVVSATPPGYRYVKVVEQNGEATVFLTNAPDDVLEMGFVAYYENPLNHRDDDDVYSFAERHVANESYYIERPIFDELFLEV